MASIDLPEPNPHGETSVERAIATRASRRSFAADPITLEDAAQLLWAAQGVTHVRDGVTLRTAPSAGATFPLTVFLEVAPDGCEGIDPGLYRYEPAEHALEPSLESSLHDDLTRAALQQPVVEDAPATIVVAADDGRTIDQYPEHGKRYVRMEAGHVAQNVHLTAEARALNACPVGAFSDAELADVLSLPAALDPLYLLPVGNRPRET
ncbi:SagB/ThcOx family dehydrogenase [Halobiforma nitratireducens]|uniref:SagB-type dehydrogenase domain-containing protein n=1 Tax=Halobiforma nitratireducens JCM 10879 TaxID=1227454 RepID=M0LW17_9EURY|nr:SagB/ThcOx family dehydrogenase [Halobiforma nitratireducens]EMA37353.1 SagB-type dehydrogenase domain-containing protein [Halobiforma nitratireducens JCM 10879]